MAEHLVGTIVPRGGAGESAEGHNTNTGGELHRRPCHLPAGVRGDLPRVASLRQTVCPCRWRSLWLPAQVQPKPGRTRRSAEGDRTMATGAVSGEVTISLILRARPTVLSP